MGDYAEAAEIYDLLYGDKDYATEGGLVADLIREHAPHATTVLDVACGTGQYSRVLTDLGFEVDGVDIEPAFVQIAAAKIPEGTFHVDDMVDFELGRRYDAVVSLFSAIGYARTPEALNRAIRCMAVHTKETGVVVVEPWFPPGALSHRWIHTQIGKEEGRHVVRMSRTLLEGDQSRLEFEYLIGTESGLERRSETHVLGVFSKDQMESAFREAGLHVTHMPGSLRKRGLYVGRPRGSEGPPPTRP